MKSVILLIVSGMLFFSSCGEGSQTSGDNPPEGPQVVGTLESPGSDITGLAWGDGALWAVDASSSTIYCIDISTGFVIDSFSVDHPANFHPTGLAYSEEHETVVLGLWDSGSNGFVYVFTPDGFLKGSVSMCGG